MPSRTTRQFTARVTACETRELRPSAAGPALEFAHRLRARLARRSEFAQPGLGSAAYRGTRRASTVHMAAVFALVFLFVLASAGLLVKTMLAGASVASVFALVTFLALAWGVFLGLFRLARKWEDEIPE